MKKPIASCLAAFGLAVLIAAPARANLVLNGSFEDGTFVENATSPPNDPGVMSLNSGATTISGWTVVDQELAWLDNGNNYSLTTPYGTRFLDLTGYHSSPYAGVSQAITTTVGQTYTLSFALGYLGGSPNFDGPVGVNAFVDNALLGTATTGPGGAGMTWTTHTMNFTATSSSTVIKLVGSAGLYLTGLDNVEVNAVPEPATLAVAGIAIGATLLMSRRRRANH